MSSRIGSPEESSRARRLRWPAADGTPDPPDEELTPDAPDSRLTSLRAALEAKTLQCEQHRRQIADLEQSLERTAREARDRGFAEGSAITRQQAEAEHRKVEERMGHTLAEVATLRGRIRQDAEADLVQLSLAIARRVLKRELTVDPDALRGVIRVALEKARAHELTRVRVHPDQQAAVRTCLERMGSAAVEVITDPGLEPGGVQFDTVRGILDASIEAQLQEIERGFSDRLRR